MHIWEVEIWSTLVPSGLVVCSCLVWSGLVWSWGKICNSLSVQQRLTRVLLICPVTHTLLQTIITESKLPPSTWRLMRNIGGQLNWLFNAFSVVTINDSDLYYQYLFSTCLCLDFLSRFFVVTINDPRQETGAKHPDYVWIVNSIFVNKPKGILIASLRCNNNLKSHYGEEGQEYFWQYKCRADMYNCRAGIQFGVRWQSR